MKVFFALPLLLLLVPWTATAQQLDEETYLEDVDAETDDELGVALEDELAEEPGVPAAPPLDVRSIVAQATAARSTEISGPAYEFCTDLEYEPESFRAKRLCKLADAEMLELCPAAERICYEEPKKDPFRIPDGVLYTLGVIALLLLAAGLSWFLITLMRQWRSREHVTLGIELPAQGSVSLGTLPEAEALALLRRAEHALSEGRAAEAALLLHVAALRHFEDSGLIRFHPSITNGEYLRMLRPRPDAARLFRGVAGLTDRLRFGDGLVDVTELTELLASARPLLAQPIAQRALGGGLAASVLLMLAVSGCEGQDASFFSHRPEGLAALPALLQGAGVETTVVRRLPKELPEETGVLVVRTDFFMRDALTTQALQKFLDRDLAVIVLDDVHEAQMLLPVSSTVSFGDLVTHPERASLELTEEYFCRFDQATFAEEIFDDLPGEFVTPAGFSMVARTATSSGPSLGTETSLIPLVVLAGSTLESPRVLAFGALRAGRDGEYRPGCLAVFSTSEVFSNAALTHTRNAAYGVGLIASLLEPGETVLFVDSMDTSKGAGGSVGGSMGNSKLLPLVLHAGLWVAVLFVAIGAAFGPLRDRVRTEHKAFVEHAQAVGLYYAASGERGHSHASEALARLVVARYRHQVRGGTVESWLALAEHLAERYELDRQEVLSALSSGLEEKMRASIRTRAAPLEPIRAMEILSRILSSEAHTSAKRQKES